ncbi:hypothetical protein AgCh_019277 [Apium graveolens]
MAAAVVSFTAKKLGELLNSEIKHLDGVRAKVTEIQRELEQMESFLKEADKKQNKDERVKDRVAKIRELAFTIEDVIETFAMEDPTKNHESCLMNTLRACLPIDGIITLCSSPCLPRRAISIHNISSEIDAIKKEITVLTTSLQTYGIKGLEEGQTSISSVNPRSKRIFYSHIVEKDFVGMQKEFEQLISALKEDQNHPEVKESFEKFAWVCITQQFDREKVLKEVLKQLIHETRKKDVATMDDGELVGELYNVQKENNCLVVLDDIWKLDSWGQLKDAFPVGETASGSKILVTTREKRVADIGHVQKIEGLTIEEGWQLLCKKAGITDDILSADVIVASQMEGIGKSMVKKCKGLPLAISSIGGILNGKLLREWKIIDKDISFYLRAGVLTEADEDHTVRQVLGLSYDSLSPCLRQCFLCFAKFEEDQVIDTLELYLLWMAEGLLSVEDKAEGMMLLDVAESFLDELTHRSLVQVKKNEDKGNSWSKYKTCSVHDLVRDLCLSKAEEENFIKVIHSKPERENEYRARRLCINSFNESLLKLYDDDTVSHFRSLFVATPSPGLRKAECMWPNKILSLENLKLLRIFRAQHFKFTKQEMEIISGLVYLKCLNLHECIVEELPSSIGDLRNLEILDLRVVSTLKVPNVLWKLKQLKYLYLPSKLEVVEKLGFKGLDELESIHNFDSFHSDMYELIGLQKLKIVSGMLNTESDVSCKAFLDFINSRELRQSDLRIFMEDRLNWVSWLECCFINVLHIWGPICRSPEEYEYDHTRFSSSCLGLKQWRVEEGAMPNLFSLTISDCRELEMLPEGLRYLVALSSLTIIAMPVAFKDRIRGMDGVDGVDMYKISHVPFLLPTIPYRKISDVSVPRRFAYVPVPNAGVPFQLT